MKRCAFGMAVLILLLVLSVWVTCLTDRFQEPVCRDLEKACAAAQLQDWETAEACCQSARNRWKNNWRLLAAVADHAPMEEMDGLYAQLWVSLRNRSEASFAAICAELSCRTKAIAEAHSGSWWNLL